MPSQGRRPPFLACAAVALLPPAGALRGRLLQQADELAGSAPVSLELRNDGDVTYTGEIVVGNSKLRALADTGSFELLVFGRWCASCFRAARFDEKASWTFTRGNMTEDHSYGSGQCKAFDGYDKLQVGGLQARRQAMWVASDCQMPLLRAGGFNAVFGLGPPGQPEITASRTLEALRKEQENLDASGTKAPLSLLDQIQKAERDLAAARRKPSALENLGVKTFSECLGRKSKSPGWLIFNDATRQGMPGVLKIPVVGKVTWGVIATDLTLSEGWNQHTLACQEGCGAIVDTGTSLFAVPTKIYEHVYEFVREYVAFRAPKGVPRDCSDISHFPDLVLTVGGEKLKFPPSAYIGQYIGQPSAEVARFVRTDRTLMEGSCSLLFMDLGVQQVTSSGPMIILGMPFFREFYTTFDLGSGRGDRSIYVSRAGDSCEPGSGSTVSSMREQGLHGGTPRKVDVSQLRVPIGLDRLGGEL